MAWRYHGRARVSASRPQAFGKCDRCQFLYNLADLKWQYQWAGNRLQNLRLLVCDICMDVPFEHFRPVIIPPDPVPVMNARPEPYRYDVTNFRMTQNGNRRVTMDGEPRITQPTGDLMLETMRG